jgi:hypothetical protein
MSDGGSAAAIDRLPWLEDEPEQRRSTNRAGLWALVPLLLALVAGASYWLGRTSGTDLAPPRVADSVPRPAPVTTLPLPTPRMHPEPATPPPAAEPAPPPVRQGRITTRAVAVPPKAAPKPMETKRAESKLAYWPAKSSAGAAGRMVRIGTFASRAQAKKGWRRVTAIYPGMARIPAAVVAAPSLRDGKTYYRLQMGTTSQAHSEVLCQRMRIIGQSCIVVGLGKAAS